MSVVTAILLTGLQLAVFALAVWLAIKLYDYISE